MMMTKATVGLALAAAAALGSPVYGQQGQRLEARALQALGTGYSKGLAAVASEVAALDSAVRTGLAFRVRQDEVELRFRGDYPDVTLGGGPRSIFVLEYLVGPALHIQNSCVMDFGAVKRLDVRHALRHQ